jgi:hypothetical protein
MSPSLTSGGGYGIVGMCVGDLFPEPVGPQVDELVLTTTLVGDVIVLNSATVQEVWRTHVPGAAGFFNSIRIADLDGDSIKELYVAGSFGLWRFKQRGE